jgi:hypothetical protein
MSDLVRARLDNGNEKTVGREFAEMVGLEILDEDPFHGDGSVREETRKGGRPVKPHTSVAKTAAAKKTAAAPASKAEEAAQ